MPQDVDLGQLIMRLNPYTNNVQGSCCCGPPTGEMDIYTLIQTPAPGGAAGGTIPQVRLEVDTSYPGEWSFKGQPQKINKAVRIRYRYPVMSGPPSPPAATAPTVLYWVEDYLLIGYEGAGAG